MKSLWISKYALTEAVKAVDWDGHVWEDGFVHPEGGPVWAMFKLGKDAHETEAEAKQVAEKKRLGKVASLKKQIAKMGALLEGRCQMSSVKVGQVWKEVDTRFDPVLSRANPVASGPGGCQRYVEVIGVDEQEQKASLMLATQSGGHAGSRPTKASLKRFNGKRGGYALHKDVEVAP